jgi:tyrosinase
MQRGLSRDERGIATRRGVLKAVGAGVGVGIGGGLTTTAGSAATDTADLPVRRDVRSLAAHDPADVLPTFRAAVRQLKALPEDDPRNWDNLVRIHGTLRRFINCEHGNWLFLAWHRAYLHYFEEIVREVTGNERFALPYWNWLDDHALPGVFRGSGDPLHNDSRTPNSTADETIVGRERVAPVLDDPNFHRVIGGWAGTADRDGYVRNGAGGFESPAHDYVHIRTGGDMATGRSPNDPSFWAHHATMDRLWWEWNARGHPNPDDDCWLDWAFTDHFVDRDGRVLDAVTVADALRFPERAYTYDTRIGGGEAPTPASQTNTADVSLDVDRTVLGEDVAVGVDTAPLTASVDRSVVEPVLTGARPGRVLLTAEDIAMPTADHFHGRVYVGDSVGDRSDLAGTYHFWVAPPAHPPQNMYVDLTGPLRRQYASGDLGDEVPIEVVGESLRGSTGAGASTPIDRFSLSVTQSRIDGAVVEF